MLKYFVRRLAASVLVVFGVVLAGFGLRIVFENQLGQVFGAMMVWFSLLFGVAGLVFAGIFYVRGRIADVRRPDR